MEGAMQKRSASPISEILIKLSLAFSWIQKMKTLELELEEEQSKADVEQLPTDIMQNIISRLPIKSILQSRSVSKPWLSVISDPSFTKLHFTRATTALFITAFNESKRKRHLLSAACDGGPVTHLMTLDATQFDVTDAEHLNGLVLFSSVLSSNYAILVNPSTRRISQLPQPTYMMNLTCRYAYTRYLFGFDESRNEHKILFIGKVRESDTVEFKIFCMSNYSWRNIDVEPPTGFSWDHLYSMDCGLYCNSRNVCVNSVIHFMLLVSPFNILAFDLRTNKFSVMSLPQGAVPREPSTNYRRNGRTSSKYNNPRIIKINGCVGVVCHDCVVERNEMHIWELRDYENRVWVKETIVFHKPWSELGEPFPLDVNMDDIMFSSMEGKLFSGHVNIYNKKSRCFRSIQFTRDHQFSLPYATGFNQIKCYTESLLPPLLEEHNKASSSCKTSSVGKG